MPNVGDRTILQCGLARQCEHKWLKTWIKFIFKLIASAFKMDEKSKSEDPVAMMRPNRCTKRLLRLGDTFFSVFVVTPLVVSHWYGLWMFMDHHPEHFPPLGTFLFSILWVLLLTLTRVNVYDRMKSSTEKTSSLPKRICKYIFVKLYLYAFSVGCIMTYRCGFALLLEYFGKFNHCG